MNVRLSFALLFNINTGWRWRRCSRGSWQWWPRPLWYLPRRTQPGVLAKAAFKTTRLLDFPRDHAEDSTLKQTRHYHSYFHDVTWNVHQAGTWKVWWSRWLYGEPGNLWHYQKHHLSLFSLSPCPTQIDKHLPSDAGVPGCCGMRNSTLRVLFQPHNGSTRGEWGVGKKAAAPSEWGAQARRYLSGCLPFRSPWTVQEGALPRRAGLSPNCESDTPTPHGMFWTTVNSQWILPSVQIMLVTGLASSFAA